MQQKNNIFISYSSKDKKYLKQLRQMISPLVRSRRITIWDDTQLEAGDAWPDEIENAIASAKTIIFLVSSSFLDSDFIVNNELAPVIQRATKEEGLKVLWIAVSAALHETVGLFLRNQALNNPKRPLDMLATSGELQQELKKIAKKIQRVVDPGFRPIVQSYLNVRSKTLRMTEGFSEAELKYSLKRDQWSIADIQEHLLLIDQYFQKDLKELIDRAHKGLDPVLDRPFRYFKLPLPQLPEFVRKATEIPLLLMSRGVPFENLERLAKVRQVPLKAEPPVQPRREHSPADLVDKLNSSAQKTEFLFRNNEFLDFTDLRHQNQLTGHMDSLQALRLIVAHEERHQEQIQEMIDQLTSNSFAPKGQTTKLQTHPQKPQSSPIIDRGDDQRTGLWVRELQKGQWGVGGTIRLPFGFGWLTMAEVPDPRRWMDDEDSQ